MMWGRTCSPVPAHSADAVAQSFCAALRSWRQWRKTDSRAKPFHQPRRKSCVQGKPSAIRVQSGTLFLAKGRGHAPLAVPWPRTVPTEVEWGWTGTGMRYVVSPHKTARLLTLLGKGRQASIGEGHPPGRRPR
jgi:putative transposase